MISVVLSAAKYKPFISLTADQLVFGYDDALVSLAHKFYPREKRPLSKMGLLNGVSRNYYFKNAIIEKTCVTKSIDISKKPFVNYKNLFCANFTSNFSISCQSPNEKTE